MSWELLAFLHQIRNNTHSPNDTDYQQESAFR